MRADTPGQPRPRSKVDLLANDAYAYQVTFKTNWQCVLCAPLTLLSGCIDTDAAVFVEPSIDRLDLRIEKSALSLGISGSFVLKLHLGPRASGDSQISLGAFSLTNADRSQTHYEPLHFTSDATFPVTVSVDSDQAITIRLAAKDNLAEVSTEAALCDPNGTALSGALNDSLRGTTIPVRSGTTAVICP